MVKRMHWHFKKLIICLISNSTGNVFWSKNKKDCVLLWFWPQIECVLSGILLWLTQAGNEGSEQIRNEIIVRNIWWLKYHAQIGLVYQNSVLCWFVNIFKSPHSGNVPYMHLPSLNWPEAIIFFSRGYHMREADSLNQPCAFWTLLNGSDSLEYLCLWFPDSYQVFSFF